MQVKWLCVSSISKRIEYLVLWLFYQMVKGRLGGKLLKYLKFLWPSSPIKNYFSQKLVHIFNLNLYAYWYVYGK